ncbi:MAG: hypothetical protein KAU84_00470 [Thermoplasmatales archaeon]|nr:hypothetical protein [Thermoplasmatales archaeon]
MKKSNISIIIKIVVILSILIGAIVFLNEPPYGAPYVGIEIEDPKVKTLDGQDDNFTLQVSGNLRNILTPMDKITGPVNLSTKLIIDLERQDNITHKKEIVSSRNLHYKIDLNDTIPFIENFSVSSGSYVAIIQVFFLRPNEFWGSRWVMSSRRYMEPITVP